MTNYADRLSQACVSKNSRVCVGLDPRLELLPEALYRDAQANPQAAADAFTRFCCAIIEAVAEYAAAVKPQAAFFEALGPPGYKALWEVMACGRRLGLPVILDAKRSDIGSTAAAYAEAYFAPRGGLAGPDAITVNAYLGSDGVQPFVELAGRKGAGVYVLVKTSNPSSGELQDLPVAGSGEGRPVYEHICHLVAAWGRSLMGECGYSSVGAVVGATYPQQLAELRTQAPSVPFLVPGYGAQGAGARDVAVAFDDHGLGAIVNYSRGIIFAYRGEPYRSEYGSDRFAEAAAAATRAMRDEINAELGV